MKTVNKKGLTPRVVTDDAEVERLRWFQHHRYLDAGLVSSIGATLPDDPLVAHSTYFGVYQGSQIAGTARIVCVDDVPLLDHHPIKPEFHDRLTASRGLVAEISRLAVEPSMPHYAAFSLLSRELLHFGFRTPQAELLVASVERPLVRILNQLLGLPIHVIGDEIESYGHYNGACVPILVDTAACLRAITSREARCWEFFTEGLVIDLTVDAKQPSLAG